MELGGHAPVIVFDDADVDRRRQGDGGEQVPQRRPGLHLADALPGAGRRLRRLRRAVRRQRPSGSRSATAWRTASTMGALANPRRVTAMEANRRGREQARRARCAPAATASATRATSSSRRSSPSCRNDAKAMNEEPFGPMAIINPFKQLRRRGEGGQPPAVRPRRLRLDQVGEDRERDRRAGRDRHDVDQPRRPRHSRRCRSAASRIRATAPKAASEAIEPYLNPKFVSQAGL